MARMGTDQKTASARGVSSLRSVLIGVIRGSIAREGSLAATTLANRAANFSNYSWPPLGEVRPRSESVGREITADGYDL
jgi:hypothetical protein